MDGIMSICWDCFSMGDVEEPNCFKCGKKREETDIKTESYQMTLDKYDFKKVDRYILWRYARTEDERRRVNQDQGIESITQDQLEYVWICPRCACLHSKFEKEGVCSYCSCEMIPTEHTIGELLETPKADYPTLIQKIYSESCYGKPLFDQYEFHQRRIKQGEEEDPQKEFIQKIGQEIREAIRATNVGSRW